MITPIHDWLTLDEHGIQMPWYTRPCLEVIDTWDFHGKNVFEYGVGYSSVWYKSRGALVMGVDVNERWFRFFVENVGIGAMCKTDEESYCGAIDSCFTDFDIVIIDGSFRDDCTEYALKHIKPGGNLILENWLQPEVEEFWPKTEALIKGMPIEIYKEPDHPHWKTAIVTKP